MRRALPGIAIAALVATPSLAAGAVGDPVWQVDDTTVSAASEVTTIEAVGHDDAWAGGFLVDLSGVVRTASPAESPVDDEWCRMQQG